jgi:hypothetical protein
MNRGRKPPLTTFEITERFEGKDYTVNYSLDSDVVTVHSIVGQGVYIIGPFSRIVPGSAESEARYLAREVLGAKKRGEL